MLYCPHVKSFLDIPYMPFKMKEGILLLRLLCQLLITYQAAIANK